jgi:hypothetical protein
MLATIIKDEIKKVKAFGYEKETFGYHHWVNLKESNDQSVQCVLFSYSENGSKSREFSANWEDLVAFLYSTNTIFENYLKTNAEKWTIDIEKIRYDFIQKILSFITE